MTLLAAGLLWAAWCAGCIPDELPAYVNDGKTVVAMADDGTGAKVLWTYDVRTGTVSIHRPPEKWEFHGARMLGGQIWVDSCLPSKTRPGEVDAESCERFDPVKKEFLPGPPELEGRVLPPGVIPAYFEGEKCLLVPVEDRAKGDYDVFSFPELKKKKKIHNDGLMAAGNFWSLHITRGDAADRWVIRRIDLLSPDGKKVSSIARDDTGQTGEVTNLLRYARVGDDGKALLLIFAERGIDGFSVFDATSGKFLWGHESVNDWSLGTPLIKRTEIWTMQFTEERDAIVLVRYSPGAGAEAQKANCEAFVVYSTEDMDLEDGGRPEEIDQFTPSPDGSHFVMVINGNPSRLLFIPIRKDVTTQDVRMVELTVTKPPAAILEK
jgi:hypothetical protein